MEDHPLRLARGSHKAGSGKGCAMNVISWENGDTTITDYPSCVDDTLAVLIQLLNDEFCLHRDEDMLCPACSLKVLDVAHSTVGTTIPGRSPWTVYAISPRLLTARGKADHLIDIRSARRYVSDDEVLDAVRAVIDIHRSEYGIPERQPDPQVTAAAVERMLTTTAAP